MKLTHHQYLTLRNTAHILRHSGAPLTEEQTQKLAEIEAAVKAYQDEGERRLRAAFAAARKEDRA